MTPLERAAGLVIGADPDAPPALPPADGRSARTALEDALRQGLQQPPCLVSFSGGRDSSAVLATAVHVARRDGLPLPVPVTLRFPGVASTEESGWQELVIAHLGLTEWVRIQAGPEMDVLGEIATAVLRRHGLLWPWNAFFHVPIFQAARGGCVLTGLDGDGLLGAWRWSRPQSVLARRVRPRPRDVARVAYAALPPGLRLVAARRQFLHPPVSWLRPAAQRAFVGAWRRAAVSEPRRWDRRLDWYSRRRWLLLAQQSLGLLAADCGTTVRHPFADRGFLSALAVEGGANGWGNRTETMRALFADRLPPALLARGRKAEFGRAFWREQARSFAREWDGTGVDTSMVDPDRLRSAWAMENPWFAATTLLHAAWLGAGVASGPTKWLLSGDGRAALRYGGG